MGSGSALYTAVSGLDAMSSQLSVIGNNIANSTTVGFKGDSATFANLLSTSNRVTDPGTSKVSSCLPAISRITPKYLTCTLNQTPGCTSVIRTFFQKS